MAGARVESCRYGRRMARSDVRAARAAGVLGDDDEVADTVFHALCGMVTPDDWLASQPGGE